MKIIRDPQSKHWVLQSDSLELYRGRKSPWDHPAIIREALEREAQARGAARGPRREHAKSS
jgi:hypothetical protein